VGCIHFIEQPAWEPVVVRAASAGFLMTRRAIPMTQQGDCVAVIARPCEL
jgi:predicted deacylase